MSQPKIMLATLCLNEMEWLDKLYAQHRNWPGLVHWCFVEGVDREYERANPDLCTEDGRSIDGTTAWLDSIKSMDPLVSVVRPGVADCGDAAQNKTLLRQAYLDKAEEVKPDFIVVLDADEFYILNHQQRICEIFARAPQVITSFIFLRREIWRPPYYRDRNEPLMAHEVVGGFWKIPCCHWWRWLPGMGYRGNHNTPEVGGNLLIRKCERHDSIQGTPQMIHFGFAADPTFRVAKNNYYATRGEDCDPKRAWYVNSRGAWYDWKPGDRLPEGARVIPYVGPVPECFM